MGIAVLWLLTAATLVLFLRARTAAGLLLATDLCWAGFAMLLNAAAVLTNSRS